MRLERCSQTASLNWFCWCFLCYQFQAFEDSPPFAVLGTCGCVHVTTSEDYRITGCASLLQFRYGAFKFCKLSYNIYLFKAFMLTVMSTDDTWSGTKGSCKWTDQKFWEKDRDQHCESIIWDLCIAQSWCFLQSENLKLHLVQLSDCNIKSRSWFCKSVQGCKINFWFINIHLEIL